VLLFHSLVCVSLLDLAPVTMIDRPIRPSDRKILGVYPRAGPLQNDFSLDGIFYSCSSLLLVCVDSEDAPVPPTKFLLRFGFYMSLEVGIPFFERLTYPYGACSWIRRFPPSTNFVAQRLYLLVMNAFPFSAIARADIFSNPLPPVVQPTFEWAATIHS